VSTQSPWILLGASRGLGKSFSEVLESEKCLFQSYSRKNGGLDFSKKENWPEILKTIVQSMGVPSLENFKIIYFAGGGPYGAYQAKKFADHEWAWRVNFEFPAFLLHSILSLSQGSNDSAINGQVCFVGSAIAENKADVNAASYSAAKHALRGLLKSVQGEQNSLDVRLFSPGYMDTDLLPQNAWPRQVGAKIHPPKTVAIEMYKWLQDSTYANGHKVFE
jgi:short-subunit dehydrogenase